MTGEAVDARADAQRTRVRRLEWACRRGLLELELWLEGFVAHHVPTMTPAQEAALVRLLDEPDPLLLAYLTLEAEPDDPALRAMVAWIREHRRAN